MSTSTSKEPKLNKLQIEHLRTRLTATGNKKLDSAFPRVPDLAQALQIAIACKDPNLDLRGVLLNYSEHYRQPSLASKSPALRKVLAEHRKLQGITQAKRKRIGARAEAELERIMDIAILQGGGTDLQLAIDRFGRVVDGMCKEK